MWGFFSLCGRIIRDRRAKIAVIKLRSLGKTIPYEAIKSQTGTIIWDHSDRPECDIPYWWVPSTEFESSDSVYVNWFSGKAIAFDCQSEIARMIRRNEIIKPILTFRVVETFSEYPRCQKNKTSCAESRDCTAKVVEREAETVSGANNFCC